jgi:hypothetical protein
LEILKVLTRQRVDFIVVGGVSVVLHGAPVTTFDLDVVHARDRENITRLLSALEERDAVYRVSPERQLRPDESHLSGPGYQLLLTKFGPLDVRGMIGKSWTWADLSADTRAMEIEPGITSERTGPRNAHRGKRGTGIPKDLAVLPVLWQALKERSERKH